MRKPSVLIADDLRFFLEVEKTFLEKAGFEVQTTETGEGAVVLASQMRPNLILLDLQMPGTDGTAACAAIREDSSLALTPIIIMSVKGSEEIRELCLKAGCTEFVVKPEKPDELLGLVARVLAGRRRKTTRISVVFSGGGAPDRQMVGQATNLSGSGLLLVTNKALDVGEVLDLEFVLPMKHITVRVQGKVTRTLRHSAGVFEEGIHFVDISASDQESIMDYVSG